MLVVGITFLESKYSLSFILSIPSTVLLAHREKMLVAGGGMAPSPKDVHVLIPESVNMLDNTAERN